MITVDQARRLIEQHFEGDRRTGLLKRYLPAIEEQWECWTHSPELAGYCERDLATIEADLKAEIPVVRENKRIVLTISSAPPISDEFAEAFRKAFKKEQLRPLERLRFGFPEQVTTDLSSLTPEDIDEGIALFDEPKPQEPCTRCNGTGEVPGFLGVGLMVSCEVCRGA